MYKDIIRLENEVINATKCVCGRRMSYKGENNGFYVFACKDCEKGKTTRHKTQFRKYINL